MQPWVCNNNKINLNNKTKFTNNIYDGDGAEEA